MYLPFPFLSLLMQQISANTDTTVTSEITAATGVIVLINCTMDKCPGALSVPVLICIKYGYQQIYKVKAIYIVLLYYAASVSAYK